MADRAEEIAKVPITRNMMLNAARGCIGTMEILNTEHSSKLGTWHVPYYLLAATGLELFPKIYLAHKKEKTGSSADEIEEYLRKLGHDLEKLYSVDVVGADFLARAGIKNVQRVESGPLLTFRYDFITDHAVPIQVYHLESLRYGLMTGGLANVSIIAYQFDELLEVCQKVQLAAR
jgi:hypothetical protein